MKLIKSSKSKASPSPTRQENDSALETLIDPSCKSPDEFGERSESEPKKWIKPNCKPSVVRGAKRSRTQRSKSEANLSKRPKGVNQNLGHAPVNQRAAPWRVQLT